MDVKKLASIMQAAAGVTGAQMAQKLHITPQAYSGKINAKDIKLTALLEIAAVTGCKLTLTGPGINIDLAPDAPAPQEDN